MKDKLLAAIRIRGVSNKAEPIRNTLDRLRLRRKHVCVVLSGTPNVIGMLKKVKDYVTYGEVSEDVLKELIEKRGRLLNGKKVGEKVDVGKTVKEILAGKSFRDLGMKSFFRLAPPRKGFERKGIKRGFKAGGVLGYRGEKINDLIKKMV